MREDNADLRLTEQGRALGVVGEARWHVFCEKRDSIARANEQLHNTWVRVGHNEALSGVLEASLMHDCRANDLLKRPEITYGHLQAVASLDLPELDDAVAEQVEIQRKYAGYIERQEQDIAKLRKYEETRLPEAFDYHAVSGLSLEVIQKLTSIRPASIAQAGRISGITPAALSLLLVHLKKQRMLA